MTWLAPASRYSAALSVVTPPPSCSPPGYARSAPSAASLQGQGGARSSVLYPCPPFTYACTLLHTILSWPQHPASPPLAPGLTCWRHRHPA